MHEVSWALLPTGPKTAAALHHEVWQLQETAFSEMVSGMQPISLGLSKMLLVSIAQHVLCSKQGERSLRCMMCCGVHLVGPRSEVGRGRAKAQSGFQILHTSRR